MLKMDMDKKMIIGFVVVFILGLGIGSCASRWHQRNDLDGYGFGRERMMYNQRGLENRALTANLTMDQQMANMMSPLTGKTGDDLDKAFLQQMIVHHQGAVAMAELLAKGTKRPELQKMAKDIIEAQTKEIDQMDIWLTTWFSKK